MQGYWLVGNLAAAPEAGKSGTPMARFRIATDAYDPATKGRKSIFIPITAFGKNAELMLRYGEVGKEIRLRGHLEPRTWVTASGDKKYELQVITDEIELGPSSSKRAGGGSGPSVPEPDPGDFDPGEGFTF